MIDGNCLATTAVQLFQSAFKKKKMRKRKSHGSSIDEGPFLLIIIIDTYWFPIRFLINPSSSNNFREAISC